MTAIITTSTGAPATTTPALILGYTSARGSQNIMHELIGGEIAFVQYPAKLRNGTLRLFYPTRADAFASLNLHARVATFALAENEVGQVKMTYVVAAGGEVGIELDDTTRNAWVVTVDFQEIVP